jgi:predicted AAA+ superfamily ATPase
LKYPAWAQNNYKLELIKKKSLQNNGANVKFTVNMTLVSRFFKETGKSYFLFGPRGTGKSTWLKQVHSNAAWIELLDSATYRSYLARPERLSDFVDLHKNKGLIVIDEIQRVPQLLPMVHKLMEKIPDIRFILTGSSARKLRQEGIDLLGGRAVQKNMHPFIAAELGEQFSIEKSVEIGLVPLVWSSSNPAETLKGYIGIYLEQEIRAEGLIRKLDNFTRFLETLSFSHGNLLSLSEIARECEVKRSSVDDYVQICEDLLIAKRIPVFTRRAKRGLVAHSKFYFFDCGVFRSLRPSGPLDRSEELIGQALEGLVFQHLQAWIDYGGLDARIFFWRTRSGNEVDFIIYGNSCFWAIEVKNTSAIRNSDLRQLKEFLSDYPEATPLFLYRGKEAIKQEGIACIPVERFLANLNPSELPSLEKMIR